MQVHHKAIIKDGDVIPFASHERSVKSVLVKGLGVMTLPVYDHIKALEAQLHRLGATPEPFELGSLPIPADTADREDYSNDTVRGSRSAAHLWERCEGFQDRRRKARASSQKRDTEISL